MKALQFVILFIAAVTQWTRIVESSSTSGPTWMSSVVAIKFNGGVLLAADVAGKTFTNMIQFPEISRIKSIGGDSILVCASGSHGDYDEVFETMQKLFAYDRLLPESTTYCLDAKKIFNLYSKLLYGKRIRGKPIQNSLVICGRLEPRPYARPLAYGAEIDTSASAYTSAITHADPDPEHYSADSCTTKLEESFFLGCIDTYGTPFADENYFTTGIASHLAMPLLRKHWRPHLSENEAISLAEACLDVLTKRDVMASPMIQMALLRKDGVEIKPCRPLRLNPKAHKL